MNCYVTTIGDGCETVVYYEFHEGQRLIVHADPDDCQEGIEPHVIINTVCVINLKGVERDIETELSEKSLDVLTEECFKDYCGG